MSGVVTLVRSRGARWIAGVALGLAALAGIAYLAFKVAPDLFAETKGLDPKGRADARQGVRTASLALFAGAIAVVGAIYTGQTYRLNRESAKQARERDSASHALDQARQITERFTRAVDQLGNNALDVRLGGIYALERIARDSEEDHPQVVEVLTAYVREHAPWPPPTDRQPSDHATATPSIILPTGVDSPQHPAATAKEPHSPDTDVQAALTVVGRRKLTHERKTRPPLLLSSTDLRRANLWGANLERANLKQVHLEEAYLEEANLERANLEEANLERAYLEEANLGGASLERANLKGARYDYETQWPKGFNPDSHRAVRAERIGRL